MYTFFYTECKIDFLKIQGMLFPPKKKNLFSPLLLIFKKVLVFFIPMHESCFTLTVGSRPCLKSTQKIRKLLSIHSILNPDSSCTQKGLSLWGCRSAGIGGRAAQQILYSLHTSCYEPSMLILQGYGNFISL